MRELFSIFSIGVFLVSVEFRDFSKNIASEDIYFYSEIQRALRIKGTLIKEYADEDSPQESLPFFFFPNFIQDKW